MKCFERCVHTFTVVEVFKWHWNKSSTTLIIDHLSAIVWFIELCCVDLSIFLIISIIRGGMIAQWVEKSSLNPRASINYYIIIIIIIKICSISLFISLSFVNKHQSLYISVTVNKYTNEHKDPKQEKKLKHLQQVYHIVGACSTQCTSVYNEYCWESEEEHLLDLTVWLYATNITCSVCHY